MSKIYAINCFYDSDNINELEIITDTEVGKYKIYKYDFESKTKLDLLLECSERHTKFEDKIDNKKRQFYLFESDTESIIFSHRIVPLNGMYNVRDLGGYLTKDNKRIKWGTLLRGDHLINLDEDSFVKFMSMNIDTIVDLRSFEEINSHPNPYLNQKQTIYCDPNAHTAAFAGAMQDLNSDGELNLDDSLYNEQVGTSNMESQQRRFTTEEDSKNAFARMIRALASEETNASYQHCRGGKDRTGYALMLIAKLLNVSENLIVFDYMLTKKARLEKNILYKERFIKMAKGNMDIAEYMYSHFDTKESYIDAALDEISKHYESVEEYVKAELNITDEMINRLRDKYLE